MENTQFPKGGLHEPINALELFLRDFEFVNYHINHDKWDLFLGFDIIDAHRFEEDFCCDELSSCWVETKVERGSGAAGYACPDMVNGILYMYTNNAAYDSYELTQDCECWKLVANYPLYAEIRFMLLDALETWFWFGLVKGNAGYFGGCTDYVIIEKDDGETDVEFENVKNSNLSYVYAGITFENQTWYRMGFHWDGAGNLRYFIFRDGDAPQYCMATHTATTDIPDDEELALGFGLANGDAESKGIYIDYVKCVQKRVIETHELFQ
jgi:hypothetical protein